MTARLILPTPVLLQTVQGPFHHGRQGGWLVVVSELSQSPRRSTGSRRETRCRATLSTPAHHGRSHSLSCCANKDQRKNAFYILSGVPELVLGSGRCEFQGPRETEMQCFGSQSHSVSRLPGSRVQEKGVCLAMHVSFNVASMVHHSSPRGKYLKSHPV